MSRRYWALGCVVASVLAACEEKMMTDNPPAPGAPPPPEAAAAAAAAAQSAAAPPRVRIEESDFVESDRNRDPFRSFARAFVEETKGRSGTQREVVLADYSLDELKLIGIVTRMQPAKAMLVDPTGKGHVVQRGQFVGRPDVVQGTGRSGSTYEVNWRVENIRDGDVVLVRSDPANPDVPTATRVIPLRPDGSRIEH